MDINKNIIENALNFYEIDNQAYINKCHSYITNILLLLGYNTHLNNMKKYRLDEEQCKMHKKRVKDCLINDIFERKYDGIRISQMLWGVYFVNVKLLEVGRLQYECCKCNPMTKKEELCIKIHIPSGKKLDIKEVKNSLNKSNELIDKYFRLDNPKYYCESWLLSNQVRYMLDDNSNISKFHDLFDIIEGEGCIDDILNFVYNIKECYNYTNLEENTSLQRKIKEFLLEGKKIYLGIGTLR